MANTPTLVSELERLLLTLQDHYRLEAAQPDVASRARAVRRALDVLASEDSGEWLGRLAWNVLGSKAAAQSYIGSTKHLAEEAAYQANRKGRPSIRGVKGDGGKPQDLIRRWFAVKVQSAFRAHGVPSGRTQEGPLEHTLHVLLELAGHPSSDPLRLLRPPKAR